MILVLGENNTLSEPVSAVNFNASLHQILQNGIYCFLVEHKLIESRRRNKVRYIAVFGKIIFITLPVFFGKVVISDALFKESGLDFIIVIRNEYMIGIYSSFVIIGIGRHTIFNFKEVIGIAVNIHFRCSRQSNHNRIEVFKYSTVLFENTSVAFIRDYKIKMSRRKQRYSVLCLCAVYCIQYSRIS